MAHKSVGQLEAIIMGVLEEGKGSCSLYDVLRAAREKGWDDPDIKSEVQILIAWQKLRTSVDLKLESIAKEPQEKQNGVRAAKAAG